MAELKPAVRGEEGAAGEVFHGGEAVAELKPERVAGLLQRLLAFSTAVKPWPN